MENIRITAGDLRGRVIRSPKSKLTHPMGAREKLALFNMIAEFLPGALVLDAFAGSGALGIEALSRGAKEAVFIEQNRKITGAIKENLKSLGLMEKSKIFAMDAKKFETEQTFEVILADPPYDKFDLKAVQNLANFLRAEGVLALSHPGEAPQIDGLTRFKTRQYAAAHLSIYLKH